MKTTSNTESRLLWINAMRQRNISLFIVVVILLGVGLVKYFATPHVCEEPIPYQIGMIDPSFNVSHDQLQQHLLVAEELWEQSIGRDLFVFNQDSDLTVNLIFDDRQQRTLAAQASKEDIEEREDLYQELTDEYQVLITKYGQRLSVYNGDLDTYESDLEAFNEYVEELKLQEELTDDELAQAQEEEQRLQTEGTRLEQERRTLNELAEEINKTSTLINSVARQLSVDIGDFNDRFGHTDTFDQGDFFKDTINIYQFGTTQDLELVLAHELGHALGLEHVDDPHAIMHFLLQDQDASNLQLTQADIDAVVMRCDLE